MTFFPCPYLGDYVELSNEREQHIENRHPDLLPTYRSAIEKTLADPDQIRQSRRFGNVMHAYLIAGFLLYVVVSTLLSL